MNKFRTTITNRYFSLFFMIIAVASSGCATRLHLNKDVSASSEFRHVYEKNYKLNESKKINVGEPIVLVKDYYLNKKLLPYVIPTENVSMTAVISVNFNAGEKYPVVGNVVVDNKKLSVVPSNKAILSITPSILVNEDGSISTGSAAIRGNEDFAVINMSADLQIVPPTAKMIRGFEEEYSGPLSQDNKASSLRG